MLIVKLNIAAVFNVAVSTISTT